MASSSRRRPSRVNEMMIDLHNHILHGLDDGPETMDESIQMCWISYRDGVRTIVATPHTLDGEYQNDRPTILAKVKELNDALTQCGLRNSEFGIEDLQSDSSFHSELRTPNSELRILPGADVHFSNEIPHQLDQEEVMTVGDGKRFLMLEFPFHTIPIGAEEVLFQLMARGIIPVISHPERNLEITRKPKRYYEMIRMGCFGQVTAMSLTGGFGAKIKSFAEKMLKKRLIHLIASDAHNVNGRPPILSTAIKETEKIVGREEAQKMVTEYPSAILEGRKPSVPEPIAI
jgi:protein-tyrosine phosphatase